MAPIVVESEVLAGAGVSISAVGDEIAAAVTTLAGALPNGAMAGHDKAGIAFGHAYRQAAQALMDAGAAAASGGRTVGFGVQMSATNYSRADASSTIGGGAAPLAPPTAPGEFDAPSVPSPFGGGVAEPFLWSMVQMLVGDVWPDGDPAQLRLTASVWSAFARSLASIGAQLAAPSAMIAAQRIPEGDAMASALSDLKQGLSDITVESVKLGQQIFEFATDIESAQNAIRDLLSRLSPAGIFDGIQAVFSGDAMEELREIAEDIRTVLDDLGRQANARKQSLQDVVQLIDDAVVSLQQKARKEFTDYLGEDVGNAVATVFDTHLNLNEGFIKGAIGTIADLQQLDPFRLAYDFEGAKETWGGMLETNFNASPVGTIINPERAFDTQMEMLKGLVHAEDWTTDRPGLGLGQNMFDVGSALIPGGAASKTTKATSITDDLAEGAGPPMRTPGLIDNAATDATAIAGRAEDIGNKLDNVGDNITPNATPNATGPAIPRGLTEPPSVGDAPTPTPRAPDAPTPHLPDATQGDRTAVAPHNSTPTATPHAPDAGPRADAPPMGAGPGQHAPAADLPGNGQHSAPAPAASAPAGGPSGPTAPPSYEPPATPRPESPTAGTTSVDPGIPPNGSGPHGQPDHDVSSGNADNGSSGPDKPGGDDPPDPTDHPNNPSHTGLYDPPANHAPPGEPLPDLTDINNEYRLPSGAVDPARFDEWTEKVAEAYPTITKDGVQGVYNYTTENYQGMNPYLRNVDDLSLQQSGILGSPSISDMTDAQRASWEAQIKQTDEGLAALPPYRADPADTTSTTWRGLQASDSVLDRMQVGVTFSDPGYLSTTTNSHVAEAFARADPDAAPTLITVVGRDGVDVKDLSRYMDESEILFPRSTQFEVVFREMGPDGLLRITVRQIDP